MYNTTAAPMAKYSNHVQTGKEVNRVYKTSNLSIFKQIDGNRVPNLQHVKRLADSIRVYGMNTVQGHYHTKFSIGYYSNPDALIWGMQVGCLIHQKSMAFDYAKNFKSRFIVGHDSVRFIHNCFVQEVSDLLL